MHSFNGNRSYNKTHINKGKNKEKKMALNIEESKKITLQFINKSEDDFDNKKQLVALIPF